VDEAVKLTAALRQGPPRRGAVDAGAICTPAQLRVIDALVADALARGARALVGGRPAPGPGTFYPPTVLVDVTEDMRIVREELFGPVMLVMKARDDAEAVRIANATEFGLQASVFSRDRARAERIAAQLEAGGVCINDFGMCYLNQDLPFGGVKSSGFGRMNGRDGLRAYTNARAVLGDRFGFSVLPKLYPVQPGDYARARASIRLLFASGIGAKLRALRELLRARKEGRP
jgi:acyl-CoA reductase-like NAD-dependent aldehyde dehydrogenase